jgi:tetratricopeptide (TPR) repeat protein
MSSDYEATVAMQVEKMASDYEAMQVEKGESGDEKVVEGEKGETQYNNENAPDVEEKPEETTSDETKEKEDDGSVSSTESNGDSDKDTPPTEDPEVLLIKATTLKEEGNNCFMQKDYEKASRAYRRGTNALKPLNKANTGDEQVKALLVSLQTNLSMMLFKLDKHKQSVQVATSALDVDRTSVKARYRRACAHRKLGNSEEARHDLREALKYDANNTAVKKELIAIKKEMDCANEAQKKGMQKAFSRGGSLYLDDIDKKKAEEKRKKEEEKILKKKQKEAAEKKRKVDWEDECVKRMSKGEDAISFEDWEKECGEIAKALAQQRKEEENRKKDEKKKAQAAAKKDNSDSDGDELTEAELKHVRGYKKTADGRVTSYFTREQSAQEKSLLGDIAPKKLAIDAADSTNSDGRGSASAWNQAGTWEEKDTTEWCSSRLQTRLTEIKAEGGPFVALVATVEGFAGDASVAIVGGKKRYIFDFHCNLVFDIRDPGTDEVLASGTLRLPDICSTHHEELEVIIDGWKTSPSGEHEQSAIDCRLALCSEVRESVNLWVKDFNEAY